MRSHSRTHPLTEGRKRRASLDPVYAACARVHEACDNWLGLRDQGVCPRCGSSKENAANMHCDPCRMDWRRRKQVNHDRLDSDLVNALRNSAGQWQIRVFDNH